jgi:hypothetical protein
VHHTGVALVAEWLAGTAAPFPSGRNITIITERRKQAPSIFPEQCSRHGSSRRKATEHSFRVAAEHRCLDSRAAPIGTVRAFGVRTVVVRAVWRAW